MKKTAIAVLAAGVALSLSFGLAACGGNSDKGDYVTVTYMDGTTVLSTEQVKKGEVPAGYTPTKDGGYQFVDWFATPSKNHKYDMTAAVTEDVTVYAGFTLFKNDTRDFYIIGAGTSSVLIDGWGVLNDAHLMTKDPDKNEYTITVDLLKGDQFVFVQNDAYYCKRGFGYLDTLTLSDGTAVFSGEGSVYDESSKGSNIVCEYSGNYTITLKTYPNEDYYNESGTGYTEATKEIYNIGTYDTIEWVRNGDPVVTSVTTTDYYIKGSGVSDWGDMVNTSTKMSANGDIYTLTKYLKSGEEFMFATWVTVTEAGKDPIENRGAIYVNSKALDEASRELVNGYESEKGANMVAKADGEYTFTYNAATEVLSISYKAATLADHDYYLDGKFGTFDWKEADIVKNPFEDVGDGIYKISAVDLKVGDSLTIRSYPDNTATPGWTNFDSQYGYYNINPKNRANFEADGTNNFKATADGCYDITIDNYSKIIVISEHKEGPVVYDIYVKGAQWSASWALLDENLLTQSSSDSNVYEITLTFEENKEFGLSQFNEGTKENEIRFINSSYAGTSGNANDKFDLSGGNIKCTTAGTYKVVYNVETNKLDFYTVAD